MTMTKNTNKAGTKDGEVRAAFIVKENLLEKIKAIAKLERFVIKDVMEEAMGRFVDAYEEKNGPVNPNDLNQKRTIL